MGPETIRRILNEEPRCGCGGGVRLLCDFGRAAGARKKMVCPCQSRPLLPADVLKASNDWPKHRSMLGQPGVGNPPPNTQRTGAGRGPHLGPGRAGAPAHDPPKAAQSGPSRRPPMLLGGVLAWRPKPTSGRAAPRPRSALSRRRRAPEKPSQPRLLPFHTRASRATAMATRLLLTVSALALGGRRGSERPISRGAAGATL